VTVFLSVEVALFLVVKVFLALVVFLEETALFFAAVGDFVDVVFFIAVFAEVVFVVDFFATLTFLEVEGFLADVDLGVGLAVAARATGALRN
jgi:hypothetical protein